MPAPSVPIKNVAAEDQKSWTPAVALRRGMWTMFSGQTTAYVITFASLPLLAAIYSPADFAALGVFSGIVAVVGVGCSLCFDKVIPLIRGDRLAASGMALAMLAASVVSLATAVFAAAVLHFCSKPLRMEWLEPLVWLLSLSVFAVGVQQVFLSWCVRRQNYRAISAGRVALAVVRVGIQVAWGAIWPTAFGLLIGFAVSNLAAAVLAAAMCRSDAGLVRYVTLARMRRVARDYRGFPVFATIPEVVQRLAVHLPAVLLAIAYDYQVAGYYVLAQRLFGTPQTLLQQAISRVFVAVGAREANNRPERIAQLFRYTLRRLLLLTSAPYLAVAIFAPVVFPLCLSDAWSGAGLYCSILAPMFFARLVFGSLRPTIDLLQRPQLHTIGSLLVVGGLVVGVSIPYMFNWPPTAGLVSLSGCMCVGQTLALVLTWRAIPTIPNKAEAPQALAA